LSADPSSASSDSCDIRVRSEGRQRRAGRVLTDPTAGCAPITNLRNHRVYWSGGTQLAGHRPCHATPNKRIRDRLQHGVDGRIVPSRQTPLTPPTKPDPSTNGSASAAPRPTQSSSEARCSAGVDRALARTLLRLAFSSLQWEGSPHKSFGCRAHLYDTTGNRCQEEVP